MTNIFSMEEIDVLDKAFDGAKLTEDGQFIYCANEKMETYYACYNKDYVSGYDFTIIEEDDDSFYAVPLDKMLSEINDSLCDFVDCYGFTDEDIKVYDRMMRRFGIYGKDVSCKDK